MNIAKYVQSPENLGGIRTQALLVLMAAMSRRHGSSSKI
jgi:hypothetical protein